MTNATESVDIMAFITGSSLSNDWPEMSIANTSKGLAGSGLSGSSTIVGANIARVNGVAIAIQLSGIVHATAGDLGALCQAFGRQPREPFRHARAGLPLLVMPAMAASPASGGRSGQARPLGSGRRQAGRRTKRS